MAVFLRRLVSQKKRRFVQDGFDLDLSYITHRVIAMGYPADGGEGLYRNPMQETIKFLQHYHPSHHKVYNLCAEKTYCTDRFQGDVEHFPFDDHQPPPLTLIEAFIDDATAWLNNHPENIIAVHCKAGKGRTGVMICCLLLYLAQQNSDLIEDLQLADDAVSDVLQWYAMKRTINSKGITLLSQQRFVRYYYDALVGAVRDTAGSVRIKEIRVKNLPQQFMRDAVMTISHRPNGVAKLTTYLSGPAFDRQFLRVPSCFGGAAPGTCQLGATIQVTEEEHLCATFASVHISHKEELEDSAEAVKDGVLQGDIKIQLFKGSEGSMSLFYTWFNTAFLPSNTNCYTVQAHELDRPIKGLPSDLEIQVIYSHTHTPILLHSDTSSSSLLSVPQPSTPDAGEAPTLHPASSLTDTFASPFSPQSYNSLASLDHTRTNDPSQFTPRQLQHTLSDASVTEDSTIPSLCCDCDAPFSPPPPATSRSQHRPARCCLHLPLTNHNLAALGNGSCAAPYPKLVSEVADPLMLTPRASSDSGWVLQTARESLVTSGFKLSPGYLAHRRCLSATALPPHSPFSTLQLQVFPQSSNPSTNSSQTLSIHSFAESSSLSPPTQKSLCLDPLTKLDPHMSPPNHGHSQNSIKAANFSSGLSASDRSISFPLLNISPTSSFPSPSTCSNSGAASPCTPANRDQRKNPLFSIELEGIASIPADSTPSITQPNFSPEAAYSSALSTTTVSPSTQPSPPPLPTSSSTQATPEHCPPLSSTMTNLSLFSARSSFSTLPPLPCQSAPCPSAPCPCPTRHQANSTSLHLPTQSASCMNPSPTLPPLHPSTFRSNPSSLSSANPSPVLRSRPPSIIPPSPTYLPSTSQGGASAPWGTDTSQTSQNPHLTPTGSCRSTSSFSSWTSYIAIVKRHPSRASSRRNPSSHRRTGSIGGASVQEQQRKQPRNLLDTLFSSFRKRKTPPSLPTSDVVSSTVTSPHAASSTGETQEPLTPLTAPVMGVGQAQQMGYQGQQGQGHGGPRWDRFEDAWATRWWMGLE